jgi:hypothetical protein
MILMFNQVDLLINDVKYIACQYNVFVFGWVNHNFNKMNFIGINTYFINIHYVIYQISNIILLHLWTL